MFKHLWPLLPGRTSGSEAPQRRWCKRIRGVVRRQKVIEGWDQAALEQAKVLLIGAGGANSEIGQGLVRKGCGRVHICDGDLVDRTNLNRGAFHSRDWGKNKAIALGKRLAQQGFLGTELVSHPCFSNELDIAAIDPTVIVCSVDLQVPATRLDVCRYGMTHDVPVVFMAVSTDADNGYVFIQESRIGSTCWSCVMKPELLPEPVGDRCPGEVGACADILKAMGGIALYAIDSLIMSRPRTWNFWRLSLRMGEFRGSMVPRRSTCPTCGDMA